MIEASPKNREPEAIDKMVFNNKIMKDVVNHRGCKCNLQ